MFVQMMRGKVSDAAAFEAGAQRWRSEVKPGAIGFLGSTWGFAGDGTVFLSARFDSEASAQANNGRPEQDAWWSTMASVFTDVSFHDCTDVDEMLGGGSDEAGFVQVIEGRAKDQEAARAMLSETAGPLAEARPDILGGIIGWHGDGGGFTQVMYFRSLEEARAAEGASMPSEIQARYVDMMAAEPTFLDLTDPHFD